MSTQNRRSSVSSSSSALMKRSSSDNHGKVTTVPPHLAKKRPPFSNITNQKNASLGGFKSSSAAGTMVGFVVSFTGNIQKPKKGSL